MPAPHSQPAAGRAPAAQPATPATPDAPILERALRLLCHDLRIPLTSITACAEVLRATGLSPEERDQFTRTLQTQSSRLARMLESLESLADGAGGGTANEREPVDVDAELRDATSAAVAAAAARGVGVSWNAAAGVLLPRWRAARLAGVLDWVLEAGARRVAAGQSVTVRAEPRGGEVCVEVGLPGVEPGPSELSALNALDPDRDPPDLVRGVAGPLWAAMRSLALCGGRSEVVARATGLTWTLSVRSSGSP